MQALQFPHARPLLSIQAVSANACVLAEGTGYPSSFHHLEWGSKYHPRRGWDDAVASLQPRQSYAVWSCALVPNTCLFRARSPLCLAIDGQFSSFDTISQIADCCLVCFGNRFYKLRLKCKLYLLADTGKSTKPVQSSRAERL